MGLEECTLMTNKEAAEILEKTFLRVFASRQNGKTLLVQQYNKAIMKAIAVLRATPDN